MIYKSLDELIGRTPLVELVNFGKRHELRARILAKLEFFNPAGSIKDRVAKAMIDDAEAKGIISPGSVIIEPTSGNTGIGLAAVAIRRGYRVIIVMPDSMSLERQKLMRAYGAELVLTDGKLGMSGAIAKAEEIKRKIPNSFIAGQFSNPSNPKAHYETTAKEIYDDTDGNIDIFVCGVGTGGTISGVGKFLKENIENIEIVAVEPESSAVISGNVASSHKIQGIGAGFIPNTLDLAVVDKTLTVSDKSAFDFTKEIVKTEGILVGISSGAALSAATALAKLPENEGKTIVVVFPDSGNRYLSEDLF